MPVVRIATLEPRFFYDCIFHQVKYGTKVAYFWQISIFYFFFVYPFYVILLLFYLVFGKEGVGVGGQPWPPHALALCPEVQNLYIEYI